MRLWLAFLRRDFKIAASYRAQAAIAVVGGLVTLTVFFFLARTMGEVPLLRARYRSDYFSFALVGVAVAAALRTMQTSFGQKVRQAQLDGSLEALLAAPVSTFRLIAHLALAPVLVALLRASLLLLAGRLFFGARISLSLWLLPTLALALLAFCALGLLSAAFVLVVKKSDPFTYLLDVLSYLFAGVVFPVEVLPHALQWISRALPATWALDGLRATALSHAGPASLLPSWVALIGFSALGWPLAAWTLSLARRHIEQAGTLPHA